MSVPLAAPPLSINFPLPGDEQYDPEVQMLKVSWLGPGYHTRIPNGTLAHPTRDAMNYALLLLGTDDPARHERAAAVIRRVLPLQDTHSESPNYGTWPWLLEESLEEMAAVDQNWAAFIGAILAEALLDYHGRLPDDLRSSMKSSLSHACRAIIKRNVTLGYTNIAAMSCAVTLAGGEALNDRALLDWGGAKLRQFLEYTREQGGFTEYNSPTYTIVTMHELERILHLVKDLEARRDAETLRVLVWEMIADHFHPGTGQWAGPHSRAYGSILGSGAAAYLADSTGVSIGGVIPRPANECPADEPTWYLPCPTDLISRFQGLLVDPITIESTFFRGADEQTTSRGVTWLTEEACLGSINHDSLWTQRRPVIGYWRVGSGPEEALAVLRLRFLKDGRDFASAAVINAQAGPKLASAVRLVSGMGDFHVSLDRPSGNQFTGADLRVRWELTAPGAAARELGPGVFELAAGNWRAVIHTAPESTAEDGRPMPWEVGELPKAPDVSHQVWVDGVYRHGEMKVLDLSRTRLPMIGMGLELRRRDEKPVEAIPILHSDGSVTWAVGATLKTLAP